MCEIIPADVWEDYPRAMGRLHNAQAEHERFIKIAEDPGAFGLSSETSHKFYALALIEAEKYEACNETVANIKGNAPHLKRQRHWGGL